MSTKTAAPKAKKPAVNPQKKLLLTASKKTINVNTVLPILEDILFTPGFARVTDLETDVTIPFKMDGVPQDGVCIPARMFGEIMDMLESPSVDVCKDFGVTLKEGKREIKLMGEDPMNFPKNPGESWKPIGTIQGDQIQDIATALCFVSTDDLRPAMTGIYFNDHIAATDAHRLFWKPIEAMKQDFILPSKSAKIILALGGGKWEVFHDKNHVKWVNDQGAEVVVRVIDARFPDYKVVIPDIKDAIASITTFPDLMLKELKNAGKFANKSTNQVVLTLNGELSIHSQDVDFSFEYNNVIDFGEFHFAKNYKPFKLAGVNGDPDMVGTIKDKKGVTTFYPYGGVGREVKMEELTPIDPKLSIGFNEKFLSEIISKTPKDTPATIKLWGPTKAAIINDHFLVMPLMLSQ